MSANALVSLVALAVGVGCLLGANRLGAKLDRSQTWQVAEGVIVSSEVREDRDARERRFTPRIEYRFDHAGREYRSYRVTLSGELRSGTRAPAERRVAEYPVGREVMVYYNPSDPDSSCLERSASSVPVLRWIGFGALALAAALQLRVFSLT